MHATRKSKLILFGFMILISSCLEEDEGCLDPNASNLDVTADINANCTYPALQFYVDHEWAGQSYRANNAISLSNGDTLAITNFQLFTSDVQVGEAPNLLVFDSVMMEDGRFIRDDLLILSLNALTFNIGHVNEFGAYDGLKFAVGYGPDWIQVDTLELNEIESSHPWFDASMRDTLDQRYAMKFNYQLINGDTLVRALSLMGPRQMQLIKEVNIIAIQANNARVNLVIDYEKLLQDIDLKLSSDDDILESMLMNMDAAIQVSD